MVLIVDDKPENIFALKKLLELNNFRVDAALSGEEALRKVLKNDYSLIILDVQMPGMDGFEVAEALSGFSKAKEIPIIFLSAISTDKKFITKGYSSGGIDYVSKPIDPDILMLKVKTFHRLYEQARELKETQIALRQEIAARKNAQYELERRVEERTCELNKLNVDLATSNADLLQFATVASHDLKEPLRKIKVFSSLVVGERFKEKLEPIVSVYLNKVIESSDRMTKLIDDLLDFSRLSGDTTFHLTDLSDLIKQVATDLEIMFLEKRAIINMGKLPPIAVAPGQMRRVFQNILSNSLKFAVKDTAPVINITAEIVATKSFDARASENGDYCRIIIVDNGIGFNEKYLSKIFAIFQRLHSREEYEGTGIGLAIVKKIIENHNGLITAKSDAGEGATFIMVLPIHQTNVP